MDHEDQKCHFQDQEKLIEEPEQDSSSTSLPKLTDCGGQDGTGERPLPNQTDIVKALEVVERDSVAIAESFISLFASLRLALSEVS